jgi:hypothetical protein
MPCHHKLEVYLDAYIEAAGIGTDRKGPLFRRQAEQVSEAIEDYRNRRRINRACICLTGVSRAGEVRRGRRSTGYRIICPSIASRSFAPNRADTVTRRLIG